MREESRKNAGLEKTGDLFLTNLERTARKELFGKNCARARVPAQ